MAQLAAMDTETGAGEGGSGRRKASDANSLWKYMERGAATSQGGGNKRITCKLCKATWVGSYTRVRAHLLHIPTNGVGSCPKVDAVMLEKLRAFEEAKELMVQVANRKPVVPLPNSEEFGSKKRKNDSALAKCFNKKARDELDCLIARCLYANGLSFNLMRSPFFHDMIKFACENSLLGYVLPSFDATRTTMLVAEKENINELTKACRISWATTGLSLVSDGWTDITKKPLINFVAASPAGPLFLKAIDTSGEVKNKEYMAKLFLEMIAEVGHRNVVQIITDNASVCRAAGLLVEAVHPSIFWTPCVVHTLNLALKNMCTSEKETKASKYPLCNWIRVIEKEVKLIRNFVVNHSAALSIYNKYASLRLLSVAETRFASTLILVKRIREVREALCQMVVDPNWRFLKDYDADKADRIKMLLVNDQWWETIDFLVSFTNPIVKLLRECDTDNPMLHLVYEKWDCMIEKVREIIYKNGNRNPINNAEAFYREIHGILVRRWTKSTTPLHCLAHCLNPIYYSEEWLLQSPDRVPPHRDSEISDGRNAAFERLFPCESELIEVRSEYGRFAACDGYYGQLDVKQGRYISSPQTWWANHGSHAPRLAKLADR